MVKVLEGRAIPIAMAGVLAIAILARLAAGTARPGGTDDPRDAGPSAAGVAQERETGLVPSRVSDACVIATVGKDELTVGDARRLGANLEPTPPIDALVRLAVDVAVAQASFAHQTRAPTGFEAYRTFLASLGGGSVAERMRRAQQRMALLREQLGVVLGPCYPAASGSGVAPGTPAGPALD